MTRYIVWNFDTHEAVEYERRGECNRCGACCMVVIRFKIPAPTESDPDNFQDGSSGTTRKGVWCEWNEGETRRFFQFLPVDKTEMHRCSQLTDDNRCLLHDLGEKKLIQSGWPFAPMNVEPFQETCSYSFQEINRWTFNEDAVPAHS